MSYFEIISYIIWPKIILPLFWGWKSQVVLQLWVNWTFELSLRGMTVTSLLSLGCCTPSGMGQMCAWSLPPPFKPTSPAHSSLWGVWDVTTVSTQVNEHTSPFFPARPAATAITDFKIRHIRIVKQQFVNPGVKSKYYSAMLGIASAIWTILGH